LSINPDSLGKIKCKLQDGIFTGRVQKKACINRGVEGNQEFCLAILSFAGKRGVKVPEKQEEYTNFLDLLAATFAKID